MGQYRDRAERQNLNEAAQLALEDFEREYEGVVCAACQQEKWPSSPFCKKCSIKLQRAHLMRELDGISHGYGKDLQEWTEYALQAYWRHYDTCRDFLIDVRRHFNSEKERTEA
ncbi:MAG TPA: hypothetical protein VGQ12_07525 [Candidatus Angelobacter sp.]|nr:hypothetical protein [Candidatus Angelobacter sp.]